MFVEMRVHNPSNKETQELYEILFALCKREEIQWEEKGEQVIITPCPQGQIIVQEKGRDISLSSTTRYAGPGFHAFVVEFMLDVQTETGRSFDLYDDLNYDQDANFDRLVQIYEDEIAYIKGLIKEHPDLVRMNTIYQTTEFYPLQKKGMIPTIRGYLDQERFFKMSEKELMPYFYLWNDWDKDAQYYLQTALYLYVKENMGTYTFVHHTGSKYANEVCDYLELAHSLDPYLALPMEIYQECIQMTERKDEIQECISMDEEIKPYRIEPVYHLYENLQIAADGAALRSIDPINQALCLMAPYLDEEQWHWLIQASLSPSICGDIDSLQEELRIQKEQEHIIVDAARTIDGVKVYFHCALADEKDIPLIESYIDQSRLAPKWNEE